MTLDFEKSKHANFCYWINIYYYKLNTIYILPYTLQKWYSGIFCKGKYWIIFSYCISNEFFKTNFLVSRNLKCSLHFNFCSNFSLSIIENFDTYYKYLYTSFKPTDSYKKNLYISKLIKTKKVLETVVMNSYLESLFNFSNIFSLFKF